MFLFKSITALLLLMAIPTTVALNATGHKTVLYITVPPSEANHDYITELAAIIKSHEGGFSASRHEPGGAVNKGVTYQTYIQLAHKLNYIASYTGFKTLSDSLYEEILWYYSHSIMADRIQDKRLRFFIIDFAWNSGSAGALYYVKSALMEHGIDVKDVYNWDSRIINAINKLDPNKLFYTILNKRLDIAKKSGIFAHGLAIRYRSYERVGI